MSKIEDVKVLVESGKVAQVGAVVQEALDAGNQPQDILDVAFDVFDVQLGGFP